MPPRLHVLLVHQAFAGPDDPGGTRHFELSRHMARKGHHITVITGESNYLTGLKPSSPRAADTGLDVRTARSFGRMHQSFRSRLLNFISFMGFALVASVGIKPIDVVWGTSPPIFQSLTAWAAARMKRVPFVFEVRDLWPWAAVDAGILRNRLIIRLAVRVERFLYGAADRIIVNSPGFLAHLRASGVPDEAIFVVPNSVEVGPFADARTQRARVRLELQWQEKFVAIYAGAHGMANHLETLLEAAQYLDDPAILIALVGDGKEKPRLQAEASKMGLSNVRFLPPQPKSRMPEILAAADVGVATLRAGPYFATVYPNKVFDYMAAGLPTVSDIDGPIRAVIEDAEGGTYVPAEQPPLFAEAIRRYAGDPETASRHGRNAAKFVSRNFDRAVQAEKLETALAAAIRGKRR